MAALEAASVRQNIAPFADLLGQLVDEGLRGKPVAKVPASRTIGTKRRRD
jgi:hypothetical protein